MISSNEDNLVEFFNEPEESAPSKPAIDENDESRLREIRTLCFKAFYAEQDMALKILANAKIFARNIKNEAAKKRAKDYINFIENPNEDFCIKEARRLCIKTALAKTDEKKILLKQAKIIANKIKNRIEQERVKNYILYTQSLMINGAAGGKANKQVKENR